MSDLDAKQTAVPFDPQTRMLTRRDRDAEQERLRKAALKKAPAAVARSSRQSLPLEQCLRWIARVGSPSDVSLLEPYWIMANQALARLGVRGNTRLVVKLPQVDSDVDFNGGTLSGWLAVADTEDVPVLQQLYGTMRLRIRHANWLKRKR